jgi:hypothetical protein
MCVCVGVFSQERLCKQRIFLKKKRDLCERLCPSAHLNCSHTEQYPVTMAAQAGTGRASACSLNPTTMGRSRGCSYANPSAVGSSLRHVKMTGEQEGLFFCSQTLSMLCIIAVPVQIHCDVILSDALDSIVHIFVFLFKALIAMNLYKTYQIFIRMCILHMFFAGNCSSESTKSL